MSNLRAILFDWDGTLADTAEATFRCYARTFEAYGIAFDRDAYTRTYSPEWYHMYERVGLAREHWDEAGDRWLAHFAEEQVHLICGAREALQLVAERGLACAIVTSGSRSRIERELAFHGVDAHFAHVTCGGDFENKKPHPEPLLRSLEKIGVAPEHAAYVGDSPEDIEMARAAGTIAVAVPGAYPNRDNLLAAQPDFIADDVLGAVRTLLTP